VRPDGFVAWSVTEFAPRLCTGDIRLLTTCQRVVLPWTARTPDVRCRANVRCSSLNNSSTIAIL